MPEGIRNRNGRYQAYVSINEKQVARTFDRLGDAKAWRAEMLAQLNRGDFIDPSVSNVRLDRWCDMWLEARRATLAEGSWVRYESVVRNHIVPGLGHWNLSQLDIPRVQAWVNSMTPSQANTNLPVLRTCLQYAVRDGRIRRNPARLVDVPHHSSERMSFLEPDELREVLDAIEDEWFHDIIAGLAFTGARLGELAALTRKHVNPLNGTIDIYATKTKTWRTIRITEPLREVVERRLAQGHDFVWTMATGTPISPPNLRARYWYPLIEELGYEGLRIHDLRHTCASWLIRAGHNPVQVCGWLGHSKPTQTLNRYAHLFGTDMGDMASSLAAMWDEAPSSNVVELGVGT